jgi:hypothetical protein
MNRVSGFTLNTSPWICGYGSLSACIAGCGHWFVIFCIPPSLSVGDCARTTKMLCAYFTLTLPFPVNSGKYAFCAPERPASRKIWYKVYLCPYFLYTGASIGSRGSTARKTGPPGHHRAPGRCRPVPPRARQEPGALGPCHGVTPHPALPSCFRRDGSYPPCRRSHYIHACRGPGSDKHGATVVPLRGGMIRETQAAI